MKSSNQVQDEFLDAGINNIIKKAELEAVTEELEYRETYGGNYTKDAEEQAEELTDEFINQSKPIEDIKEKMVYANKELENANKELENAIINYKTLLTLLPSKPTDIQSQVININKILDLYIENKKKIRNIKNEIEKKIVEIEKKIEILNAQMKNPTQVANSEQIDEWKTNYDKYHKLYDEINELFKNSKFIDENKRLFNFFSENMKEFKIQNQALNDLNYKGIYDSDKISSFKLLKENTEKLLNENKGEYTKYNDYINDRSEDVNEKQKNNDQPIRIIDMKKNKIRELTQEINRLKKENDGLNLTLNQQITEGENTSARFTEIVAEQFLKNNKLQEKITELNTILGDTNDQKSITIEELNQKISLLEINSSTEKSAFETQVKDLQNKIKSTETSTEKNTFETQVKELQDKIKLLEEKSSTEKEKYENKIKEYELTDAELKTKIEENEKNLKDITKNEFYRLMLKSADLYEKDEFDASLDKLLKYQPINEFIFKDVFTSIESDFEKYGYMEDFLKSKEIPEQIYNDSIFTPTLEKLKP